MSNQQCLTFISLGAAYPVFLDDGADIDQIPLGEHKAHIALEVWQQSKTHKHHMFTLVLLASHV